MQNVHGKVLNAQRYQYERLPRRERGLCTSISSQWCSSSNGDQLSVAHVWSRGAVVFSLVDRNTDQRTSMSDRTDLQICINIWLLTSPQTHWQNQDCMFRICPESLKLNALICRLPTSEGQSNGFIFCSFSISMRFAVFVTLLTKFGKCK